MRFSERIYGVLFCEKYRLFLALCHAVDNFQSECILIDRKAFVEEPAHGHQLIRHDEHFKR